MTSKYQSVVAEAAYALSLDGFSSSFGDISEGEYWNGLVDVSSVLLLNIGEGDLAARLRAVNGGAEIVVWIREDSDGFVQVIDSALTRFRDSAAKTIGAFERAEAKAGANA